MKKIIALLLSLVLCISLCACGKSENAKAVDGQIKAIGDVTLESEELISSAEKAVKALSEEDKEQLDYLDKLEDARKTYNELVIKSEAEAVSKKIDEIDVISLDTLEQINETEIAYDKLSSEAKAQVKNYDILENASQQLKPLKEEKINQLLSTMRLEEDRVRNLKFYNPSAFKYYSDGSWAADIRCFVLPYIGMDANSCWLRLIYNYTGDDWVFFKSIIFAIDGEQHHRSFNYFDIVHDNEGGDVWEYIDVEVEDSDIDLLKKIASSNETIVRFQGDDYSHDFTISESDKQAIRDVIMVYELKQ